jgi:hypothetical protein
MTKYEYIIAENAEKTVSKEVCLWRAVVIQQLIDLSSDADDKSRDGGFRRAAFYWIFGQNLDGNNVDLDYLLANINYKINCHFFEVCEMANLNAKSVIRQAIAILENKTKII